MKFRKKCIITVLNLICLVMCVGCFSDETDDKFKGENPYKEYATLKFIDQGILITLNMNMPKNYLNFG